MKIPGYELIEILGEGGTAVVWKARQKSLDRIVALKILSEHVLHDPQAKDFFTEEARTTARLSYAGIVQTYDAGRYEDTRYIAMELVDGVSMASLLERRGRLQTRQALGIVQSVAQSMAYAWEKEQLIHCDIKPANILIDRQGSVKISDLGVARSVGREVEGLDDHIVGTPNYISPEQVKGDVTLDPRTDIYALGATLYHACTGVLPFESNAPEEVLEKQLTGFLPDPVDVVPEVPAELSWLIERMMVRDREGRFRDWSQVLEAVAVVRLGQVLPLPMLAEGASTVLQNADRVARNRRMRTGQQPKETAPKQKISISPQHAGKKPGAKKVTVRPASYKVSDEVGADGPKRKVVIERQRKESVAQAQQRKARRGVKQAAGMLSLLLLGVGALYGGMAFWHLSENSAAPKPSDVQRPARDIVASVQPQAPGPASAPTVAKAPEPASPKDGRGSETQGWQDPDYRAGLNHLRRGVQGYRAFMEGTVGQDALDPIEREARLAIRSFEACMARAPASVDVQRRVTQSYQLISNARRARKIEL